jgi:hypothetical protein
VRPAQRPSYQARIRRRCSFFYGRGLLLAECERDWLRASLGLRERRLVSGSGEFAGSWTAPLFDLRERSLVSDSGACSGPRPAPSISCCWPSFAHLAVMRSRRFVRFSLSLCFWEKPLGLFHGAIFPSTSCCSAAGSAG